MYIGTNLVYEHTSFTVCLKDIEGLFTTVMFYFLIFRPEYWHKGLMADFDDEDDDFLCSVCLDETLLTQTTGKDVVKEQSTVVAGAVHSKFMVYPIL